MISSKVSQLVSGTQAGLKTSLLFDFGPCTHPAHPAAKVHLHRSSKEASVALQGDISLLFLSILGRAEARVR